MGQEGKRGDATKEKNCSCTHHASSMKPITNLRTSDEGSCWNAITSCRDTHTHTFRGYTGYKGVRAHIQKAVQEVRILVDDELLHLQVEKYQLCQVQVTGLQYSRMNNPRNHQPRLQAFPLFSSYMVQSKVDCSCGKVQAQGQKPYLRVKSRPTCCEPLNIYCFSDLMQVFHLLLFTNQLSFIDKADHLQTNKTHLVQYVLHKHYGFSCSIQSLNQ